MVRPLTSGAVLTPAQWPDPTARVFLHDGSPTYIRRRLLTSAWRCILQPVSFLMMVPALTCNA